MTKISFSIFILACAASIVFSQQIQSITEEQDYAFCYGLHKDGQYQLAYEELEKFLLKYPNSAKRADAYFLSGECLFALNQFTGATQRYESILTNFPNSLLADDALFRLGEIAYTSKNYQNAATTFKRVLDKYSDSDLAGEAAYWIGESNFKLNEFRDALKFYQVSYELYANNRRASYALYSVGWTYEQMKEYKRALESFQQLPTKFPQSELTSSARVRVGECYYHLKDYRKAIEYLTLSRPRITQENELAETDYLIGESYYNVEDYLNALFKYEDFLKNHKGHRLEREVMYSLGWTYLQEKNYEKSAALFDELAQSTDELAHASLFRKGIAQKLGGQKTEARATFMMCSQANSAYSDNAMYEIGLLQYDEKNYKEAKASFTKVTKDFPSSDVLAQSYRMLGETNLMLNAYNEARGAFKAASSTKDAPRDVTADAEFQEAWSLIKLKQYDEAAAQFAQFVKSYPQNSKIDEAYFWLGEAYFNAGNFQQSATNYNQVVNLYPKSGKFVEALYGLGWSSYKMG
ncbi:MAG: tetratricopeptide repeat protein, partial [Bacteroidota bacterium]